MMNSTMVFRRIGSGSWFFTGRFFQPGLADPGISEKTGYQKKNKLIDIGLRLSFGGYWKLFMDG
jgi:hypothetical protein